MAQTQITLLCQHMTLPNSSSLSNATNSQNLINGLNHGIHAVWLSTWRINTVKKKLDAYLKNQQKA